MVFFQIQNLQIILSNPVFGFHHWFHSTSWISCYQQTCKWPFLSTSNANCLIHGRELQVQICSILSFKIYILFYYMSKKFWHILYEDFLGKRSSFSWTFQEHTQELGEKKKKHRKGIYFLFFLLSKMRGIREDKMGCKGRLFLRWRIWKTDCTHIVGAKKHQTSGRSFFL